MLASRLHKLGEPIAIERIDAPRVHEHGVVIRVLGTQVANFTHEVVTGKRPYGLPSLPATLGASCVGVIEELGADVRLVQKGQLVLVDPWIRSSEHQGGSDGILLGWMFLSPQGAETQKIWHDGCWAQKVAVPATNVHPIPPELQHLDVGVLAVLMYYAISLGGLEKANFSLGESLLINGATGALGVGTLLMALAIGASKVTLIGRDEKVLSSLCELDSKRVCAVNSSAADFKEQLKAKAGGVAVLVDCSAGPSAAITDAAIEVVRPGGRVVLVGTPAGPIGTTYVSIMMRGLTLMGSFMFSRSTPAHMFTLIQSGRLPYLERLQIQKFPLEKINEAISVASTNKGLSAVVVTPN